MSQDFESNPALYHSKNPKLLYKKDSATSLKLVVSNPPPTPKASVLSQPPLSNSEFSSTTRNVGPYVYELNIQDPFHDLKCSLMLDNEKKGNETRAVCHFPNILNEENKFLEEDEDLYGIIMIQFQMKVLEQLFVFCANHEASHLTIYMDDAKASGFGIYHDFLNYCHQSSTVNNKYTEIVISIDQQTFNKWLSFMADMNLQLGQSLWREQQSNLAIRHYLKSRSRG
jgi:hypothetical protein